MKNKEEIEKRKKEDTILMVISIMSSNLFPVKTNYIIQPKIKRAIDEYRVRIDVNQIIEKCNLILEKSNLNIDMEFLYDYVKSTSIYNYSCPLVGKEISDIYISQCLIDLINN